MITVRPAAPADIDAMSTLLIASITELCSLDHSDDPAAIASWTANKTPESLAAMLQHPQLHFLVAEDNGSLAAVGCVNNGNEVGLNNGLFAAKEVFATHADKADAAAG
jgi:arginine/ornithine N-succinyltransferase beta subunit